MDFVQLKASLKANVEPAYLLYGTDYFLINKAVTLIQSEYLMLKLLNLTMKRQGKPLLRHWQQLHFSLMRGWLWQQWVINPH